MSLLDSNDLKEKQKLDKKLTRQKILLGAFLVDALEKDSVQGLKEYTANNLLNFLTRQTDKDLMADLVKGLKDRFVTINNKEPKTNSANP